MLRNVVRRAAPSILALVLTGCAASPPPRVEFPRITFQHLAPIRLDVREVTVEQAYVPPAEAPNVDHRFPVPLAEAAMSWGRDRLSAAGPVGRAHYVVRHASVVEVPLEKATGLKGLVTTDQSERYDARLEIELQILDDSGRVEGTVRVEAVRSRTVPEDITLRDRDQVWFQMTEDLMREANAKLEETIGTVFVRYVVP